jgi:glutamate formiminotransferase
MLPSDMGASSSILECVPNFSEGRRQHVVDNVVSAARSLSPVLDVHTDVDHNRSVVTLASRVPAIVDSVVAATEEAVRLIDLRVHEGVHPRIGAMDVIPFVPVLGASMEEAANAAIDCAERVYSSFAVPVFLYGNASQEHRELPDVRRNGFKSIGPDFGDSPHPTAGAVCIGSRETLVAYNIELDAPLDAASVIAKAVRASGGGLPFLLALAFPLPSRGRSQVSMNLTRPSVTTIAAVHDRVVKLAREIRAEIMGAELVGLAPRAAFEGREAESLGLTSKAKFLEDELQSINK